MASRVPFRLPGGSSGPDRPADVFVRGLLSGAFVGAVIAGSAIWERRHRRRAAEAAAEAEITALSQTTVETAEGTSD